MHFSKLDIRVRPICINEGILRMSDMPWVKEEDICGLGLEDVVVNDLPAIGLRQNSAKQSKTQKEKEIPGFSQSVHHALPAV